MLENPKILGALTGDSLSTRTSRRGFIKDQLLWSNVFPGLFITIYSHFKVNGYLSCSGWLSQSSAARDIISPVSCWPRETAVKREKWSPTEFQFVLYATMINLHKPHSLASHVCQKGPPQQSTEPQLTGQKKYSWTKGQLQSSKQHIQYGGQRCQLIHYSSFGLFCNFVTSK